MVQATRKPKINESSGSGISRSLHPPTFSMFPLRALLGASVLAISAHAALAPSAESVRPLPVGTQAPDANVTTLDGKTVKLSDTMAGKPTIVIFFRGGWCPFCSRQLAALGEHELDLRALGYQIVAVSAEPAAKLAATADATHIRYRLLSDASAAAAQAYSVAYRIPVETGKAYRENGIELSPAPDSNGFWLPVPTAFIVNRAGVIRFVYSNPDPSIRISSEELLSAAKAARDK
jgi:peroxiredoxin